LAHGTSQWLHIRTIFLSAGVSDTASMMFRGIDCKIDEHSLLHFFATQSEMDTVKFRLKQTRQPPDTIINTCILPLQLVVLHTRRPRQDEVSEVRRGMTRHNVVVTRQVSKRPIFFPLRSPPRLKWTAYTIVPCDVQTLRKSKWRCWRRAQRTSIAGCGNFHGHSVS
jgi:hypothetical protein